MNRSRASRIRGIAAGTARTCRTRPPGGRARRGLGRAARPAPAAPPAAPPPAATTEAALTPPNAAAPAPADILAWARRHLPHYFSDAPAPFHAELLGDAADERSRLLARVAPRGHAKSTCLALAYPLWCICEQRRRNIVIITHEQSLATQFVRDLRVELEANDTLREHYGDLVDRAKWAETKFTTATGVTVQAKGARASFRGVRVGPQRPDLIIGDDLESDADVASPDGRRRLEHWLRRVVLPARAPEGKLIVLGSLLHPDSLLAKLRDPRRFPGWNYRLYRAIEHDVADDGTATARALWPVRWPLERLFEERGRIGTAAFEQEYLGNPVDAAERVFRPEWLQRYEESELVPARLVNVVAVDPATGASSGDFFALWVGSIDTATGVIYTRELRLERIGITQQAERIVAAFRRWRPLKVGIECTAYQVTLKQILDDYSRRARLYLPIVAIHPVGSKLARIQASVPFNENGTFRLPVVLDPEAEAQFLHCPAGKHDDAPDVCAMGIALAREFHRPAAVEWVRVPPLRAPW